MELGYSTVLTALRYLYPTQGSRFIDLGSGYGRLGFVIGLLRPDMDFKGYEFVRHRVDNAMLTVENLDLQDHVQFYTQDLSSRDFQIPDAEIYYLYDPFSE
jgi:tRNA1(Val) A37 N6-methylase TrmN6